MKNKYFAWISILVLCLWAINTYAVAASNDPAGSAKGNDRIWGGLERVDFIHYAKVPAGAKPAKPAPCYKLVGYKWSALPAGYYINPDNSGMTEAQTIADISTAAETWDAATSKELFNDAYGVNNGLSYGIQDYKNTVAFGPYPDNNVIAVTSIWYSRMMKRIVEFDMLYNTHYEWGDATTDGTKMDLRNIATHEMGHAVGLADLYTDACADVTMYGWASYGETKKRDLAQPDVTGLQSMYGA